jgi:transposase
MAKHSNIWPEKSLFHSICDWTKFIGIDETSFKKGHNYITVVVDTQTKKVICVSNGRDVNAFDEFITDFTKHNGKLGNIELVTCDMSIPYCSAMKTNLPNAVKVIDKFHIYKHLNSAINIVRNNFIRNNDQLDKKETRVLKKSKFCFLKNEDRLNEWQKTLKTDLLQKYEPLNLANSIKIELEEIYKTSVDFEDAKIRFIKLIDLINSTKLKPLIEFGSLLSRHLNDICNYFTHRVSNAILEGTNSLIQECKHRAHGFKNLN